ncbi:PREDICTED: protein PHYTOCHROME KINASE SUBSTRATE 4-like [Camelina sativa]|uniref:Protein PHYTOCHROME KINASE SUBSTRATE 4-like n=1 Tax=Camelina sativa TaxID=90675 RepID=A0ABM0TB87_CAMSA|nr:PREDICTED: protein PHYTOCHROME KINASE SUBSTRATE 4-like [Camelina sativa]
MAQTTVTVVATKRDALDPYIKILQNRSNDIDVSFSSYLKPDNNNEQQQRQKEHEDTELSIFEARSYFSENGSNDRCQTRNLSGPRFSSVSSAKVSSCTVGHTASSEASWNSQTGLLSNKNRQGSDRDGRGSSKKGPRWFFRRRACPCSSSKSVQVQESKPRIAVPKTDSDRAVSDRVVHHHQTISSPEPIRLTIPSNTVTRSIDYTANREATAPVSNFSFPTLKETTQSSEKPALNLNKPVLNQIEPALHPIKPVLNPTSPKGTTTDEEATSDASSDLFEIERFSTQPAARPWVQPASRDSIDETMSEYGYEPSEASVTWSVMTAEPATAVAANFSRIGLSSSSSLEFSGSDKKRTGLLSCRYEKAVMVSSGQRLVQPLKSVTVRNDVTGKVLCNNGSSKQCVTSRDMLDTKSSFLV